MMKIIKQEKNSIFSDRKMNVKKWTLILYMNGASQYKPFSYGSKSQISLVQVSFINVGHVENEKAFPPKLLTVRQSASQNASHEGSQRSACVRKPYSIYTLSNPFKSYKYLYNNIIALVFIQHYKYNQRFVIF